MDLSFNFDDHTGSITIDREMPVLIGERSRRPYEGDAMDVTDRTDTKEMALRFLKDYFPILCIYIIFTVGFFGHFHPAFRSMMIEFTPWVLFIMCALVLAPIVIEKNWKVISWILVTYIVTFSLEALGVWTGLVFGDYQYGATLGYQVLEVPLVIGFNWVFVILGSVKIAKIFTKNAYLVAVMTGGLALLFDIILEPIAIHFDYWAWAAVEVPLHNYIAWFVIATGMALSYTLLQLKTKSTYSMHYLIVQFFFFLGLGIFIVAV